MNHILVLSPHPDDEAIGCGGTLFQHILDGDQVQIIFLTSGEQGGHGLSPSETARMREDEARAAAAIMGFDQIEFWRLPDGKLRAGRDTVECLRTSIELWQPDVLYVPHGEEMHPDHRAAYRLVRRALTGQGAPMKKPAVRMYEVWTPLKAMDIIVDISPNMDKKLAAVRAYKSQCAVVRFDDAVLGLNRYRGELHSWPGGDYAEIFLEMQL